MAKKEQIAFDFKRKRTSETTNNSWPKQQKVIEYGLASWNGIICHDSKTRANKLKTL